MPAAPTNPDDVSASLRAEADRLLDGGLRDVLTPFGQVTVVGSYLLDLMAWRDLDIEIVSETFDRRRLFEMGGHIADLLKPHRMHYRDEAIGRTPGLPAGGTYWGIYLGDERRGAWKIDVWCVDRAAARAREAYVARLRDRLSLDTRRTIVAIKSEVWTDPGYRKTFSSDDLYTAVLDHDVRDVDAFRAFLRSRS